MLYDKARMSPKGFWKNEHANSSEQCHFFATVATARVGNNQLREA